MSFLQSSFQMEASKLQTNWTSQCTKTEMRLTPEKSTGRSWWDASAASFSSKSGGTSWSGGLLMWACVFCPLFRLLNQPDCPTLEVILGQVPWNATTFASRLNLAYGSDCDNPLFRMQWITMVIWCLFRYYVGVLNKKTMQMEVHSAQIFNLHPVIPGIKK